MQVETHVADQLRVTLSKAMLEDPYTHQHIDRRIGPRSLIVAIQRCEQQIENTVEGCAMGGGGSGILHQLLQGLRQPLEPVKETLLSMGVAGSDFGCRAR